MLSTQVNSTSVTLIKICYDFNSFVVSVTGKSNVSEVLPTGQLSNIPWRRAGVKYTNNEAYFDVIEEVGKLNRLIYPDIFRQGGRHH